MKPSPQWERHLNVLPIEVVRLLGISVYSYPTGWGAREGVNQPGHCNLRVDPSSSNRRFLAAMAYALGKKETGASAMGAAHPGDSSDPPLFRVAGCAAFGALRSRSIGGTAQNRGAYVPASYL